MELFIWWTDSGFIKDVNISNIQYACECWTADRKNNFRDVFQNMLSIVVIKGSTAYLPGEISFFMWDIHRKSFIWWKYDAEFADGTNMHSWHALLGMIKKVSNGIWKVVLEQFSFGFFFHNKTFEELLLAVCLYVPLLLHFFVPIS